MLTCAILLALVITGCSSLKNEDSCKGPIISAADFGLIPDDGKDDTRALQKALIVCRNNKGATLKFEKGQYDFHPEFAKDMYFFVSNNDEGLKRTIFPLVDFQNLTIEGTDSSFMFHGFVNPFIVSNSDGVTFKDFSIDFSRTFHSEAIILENHEEGMDVEILPDFPFTVNRGTLLFTGHAPPEEKLTTVSKGSFYGSSHMLEFDTKKRETAYMARDFYFKPITGYPAQALGERKVRILVPGLKGTPGNTMVFGPNHRNYPGFVLSDSADIKFSNVTIHHAGGMGILGQRTRNITVDSCKVTPSGKRMLSTTADATHFVNCTGFIKLNNNLFENQKDDATNIHGIYVQVAEKTAENKITVEIKHAQQFGFDFLKPGMKVELVRGKSMITYATATVRSVNRINKQFTEVTFNEKLPESLQVGDALAEIRDYPEVTISNNIIRKNRARGMLLNCRGKTIVENNTFHSPGAAILFEGDSCFWFEQGGVTDCVIRNNTFDNCMFGVWGNAVIDVKAGIREDRENSRYNHNVLIENNTFKVYDDGTLLNAYCVDGLIWRNNKVEKTDAYPAREKKFKRFEISYCDNVSIDENKE